ncbi:MAG: hypothetical protein IPH50_05975 [Rhodanobacteraceae bacterium]|nr:hypothetical protein [Rhodanobacteraceae bacterium]
MKRVCAPLATAMMLAFSALASTHACADESQQIWSARSSGLRINNDLGAAFPLVSPLTNPNESANAAGVTFDNQGRISLSAGVDASHNDSLTTLPWCAEGIGAVAHRRIRSRLSDAGHAATGTAGSRRNSRRRRAMAWRTL